LNAIAHKDYSGGVPIQISVYSDKIIFGMKVNCPKIGQLKHFWKNTLHDHTTLILQMLYFAVGTLNLGDEELLKSSRNVNKQESPNQFLANDSSDISVEFRKTFTMKNICIHLT
jgi:ATP-dependent DNA helicase RecG